MMKMYEYFKERVQIINTNYILYVYGINMYKCDDI